MNMWGKFSKCIYHFRCSNGLLQKGASVSVPHSLNLAIIIPTKV